MNKSEVIEKLKQAREVLKSEVSKTFGARLYFQNVKVGSLKEFGEALMTSDFKDYEIVTSNGISSRVLKTNENIGEYAFTSVEIRKVEKPKMILLPNGEVDHMAMYYAANGTKGEY